ncbi:MAG: hypothetical protein CMK09_10760 [Ponticaulis sp.]|nr:hypothetical protein [Ponticaulis sp.]|tara:strand:- start:25525 stop:25809 length:285 start_codon:yes stop_codon:yes gene_type:complete
MRVEIDGRSLRSIDDFHEFVANLEGVPGYYGRNLDALSDVLMSCFSEPVDMVIRNTGAARVALGKDFYGLVQTLEDVATETSKAEYPFTFSLVD